MTRRSTITAPLAAPALVQGTGATPVDVPAPTGAASDFGFLTGEWVVRHAKRLPGSTDLIEFPGTMVHRPLFGGGANIDEYRIEQPGGAYAALAVRAFDPKSRQWAIWWLDSRYPELGLGTPVRGGFTGDRGLFYAPEAVEGRPGLIRFVWQLFPDGGARWEQAVSIDGERWDLNWSFVISRP